MNNNTFHVRFSVLVNQLDLVCQREQRQRSTVAAAFASSLGRPRTRAHLVDVVVVGVVGAVVKRSVDRQ